MQNGYYDHKPDPLEKKIRFGCVFIFGLVFGLYSATGLAVTAAVAITALIFGLLAMKYGDRFSHTMFYYFRCI